ncbi:hypothetical protein FA95DRAFT_1611730 [Auriscalpium vulgare]|uniref:Uncharacterized protein n=1 Tax=Auriscalpium vulgare TaxID=40419 RepID=A0ACB8RA84_9AGAM|nr:hypothetical protein FA95DRAFT_1611730 [Auriscalpium vulgare]
MPVSLPAEIMIMVVNGVSSANDCRSLRAVDKAFCNAATPTAFRTVGATNRRDSALGLVSLLESDLAKYVEEAVYRDSAADDNGDKVIAADEDAGYLPAIEDSLVRAFSLAAQLPRVKSLRFTFHPKYSDALQDLHADVFRGNDVPAQLHMQHALIATVGGAAPHLRVLTLANVTPLRHAVYNSSAFTAVLPFITHLQLSIAFHKSGPHSLNTSGSTDILKFWHLVVHNGMLERAKGLVSITLTSDTRFVFKAISWRLVMLPRLKYLALNTSSGSGIDWPTHVMEDFVARHGQLEWIDLGIGADKVHWVRNTHADPKDVSECEMPPSVALKQTGQRGRMRQ